MSSFTLYGTTFSLYTGKARSYLIKQKVEFEERMVGDPEFAEKIAPVIGRTIIPVLETPDGEIIQDGTDIIDWFETRGDAHRPAYPETPRQKIISLIFEMFGGEGLLRPAMHYRWNFDEHNLDFLKDQFGRYIFPTLSPEDRASITEHAQGRMRKAGVMFGAVPETASMIEEAYQDFLSTLNDHFLAVPYLLGGRPTIGDYGLIAPLFAHLGRDPYPAKMMKAHAPAVYRWVERMQTSRQDAPEFLDPTPDLASGDEVPATLLPVMALVAKDYVPELEAMVAFTNAWLGEQADLKEGDVVGGDPKNRGIGMCAFTLRGVPVKAGVLPYRFYLLARIQDAFDGLGQSDQAEVREMLDQSGLGAFIDARINRRVERRDNREVWGAA